MSCTKGPFPMSDGGSAFSPTTSLLFNEWALPLVFPLIRPPNRVGAETVRCTYLDKIRSIRVFIADKRPIFSSFHFTWSISLSSSSRHTLNKRVDFKTTTVSRNVIFSVLLGIRWLLWTFKETLRTHVWVSRYIWKGDLSWWRRHMKSQGRSGRDSRWQLAPSVRR